MTARLQKITATFRKMRPSHNTLQKLQKPSLKPLETLKKLSKIRQKPFEKFSKNPHQTIKKIKKQ
jgi:hypothetical protein